MSKSILIILSLIVGINSLKAQELLALLDSIQPPENKTYYTDATFKSIRLINGYTSETAAKNELVFSISHRFGNINQGIYDWFGLDQSTIRFGFEYGLSDRIDLGFGRSNFEKLYDGFVKIKLARQSSRKKNFPFTITLLEGIAIKSVRWANKERDYPFSARMYYIHELFIARKLTQRLSIQLSPVVIHRNIVQTKNEPNTVGAIGVGARFKITNRLTTVCEYFYPFSEYINDNYSNSLALGIEIETGGHVFQIHASNSTGMTEKAFIPETRGKWSKGDIGFGFNIIRVFNFNKNKIK
ncbi:MAG: DUF5777 family beta-barrel protein [Bacteroidales bacterium]|nr:DUF5777 family beta-barrel protein [Bacteroidales bacterium]